jgi:hypothetical protein
MEYIAFDAHKHYTLASVARPDGRLVREQRLPHERGALQWTCPDSVDTWVKLPMLRDPTIARRPGG